MNIKHVPVHHDAVKPTAHVWMPFVERIAKRGREHACDLIAKVATGEIQVHIAWDADAQKAMALAGTRVLQRGDDRIGELLWMVGDGREHWQPLINDLEHFMRAHNGCAGMRVICRPGWSRVLKPQGYRMTHMVLERDF